MENIQKIIKLLMHWGLLFTALSIFLYPLFQVLYLKRIQLLKGKISGYLYQHSAWVLNPFTTLIKIEKARDKEEVEFTNNGILLPEDSVVKGLFYKKKDGSVVLICVNCFFWVLPFIVLFTGLIFLYENNSEEINIQAFTYLFASFFILLILAVLVQFLWNRYCYGLPLWRSFLARPSLKTKRYKLSKDEYLNLRGQEKKRFSYEEAALFYKYNLTHWTKSSLLLIIIFFIIASLIIWSGL